MRRHGIPGHSALTGAGAPRHAEIVAARAQRNGLGAALQCRKCGEVVFTQKMRDAVAAPKTHQALARQASERHEKVCPKRDCVTDPLSSRTCERGTNGCDAQHTEDDVCPKRKEAAGT